MTELERGGHFHSLTQEMLRDLNLGEMKSGVPVLAVSLALEGKASHREMTSKLLSDLCGTVMSTNDVEKSFDKLLKDLPELALDTPRAPQVCVFLLLLSFVSSVYTLHVHTPCTYSSAITTVAREWPTVLTIQK